MIIRSELLTALVTASEPNPELDIAIFKTAGFEVRRSANDRTTAKWGSRRASQMRHKYRDGTHFRAIPTVTASVDEAISLARRLFPDCTFEIEDWPHQAFVGMALNRSEDDNATSEADGKSSALALCGCIIRALAVGGGDDYCI